MTLPTATAAIAGLLSNPLPLGGGTSSLHQWLYRLVSRVSPTPVATLHTPLSNTATISRVLEVAGSAFAGCSGREAVGTGSMRLLLIRLAALLVFVG